MEVTGFSAQLKNLKKPLLLDGAMGSYLQQRVGFSHHNLWASQLNISGPDQVIDLHTKYILAGSDIITTNTFRTNPTAAERYLTEPEYNNFVFNSVNLAFEARGDKNVWIAGSNSPAEDCYQRERKLSRSQLVDNHQKHISLLNEAKVDVILNETQSHWDEIEIICSYCHKQNIPFIISLYTTTDLCLLSGEPIQESLIEILKYNPLAVGWNCIQPDIFTRILSIVNHELVWGTYLNVGKTDYNGNMSNCMTPDEYTSYLKTILHFNPAFIGGCCGTTPDHISKLRRLIDETDFNEFSM